MLGSNEFEEFSCFRVSFSAGDGVGSGKSMIVGQARVEANLKSF